MFEFLYAITILPLEIIMEFVLETVNGGSDSYGVALIAVSAVVSIGVLPLYHIAEKWQDAERLVQQKMKSKIDEFKSVLKGYELHACLNTLYRQNSYHPIYAVRTSIGILIQIPFFLAAYQLLSLYEPLNGVSFWFISDLGSPDQLIKTPWFAINVLPIMMTIVNIVSSFIYGKKTSFRESLQLYGIALFFLVFLYGSPSGLLFYWTFNNVFSLIKNIAYRVIDNRKNEYTQPNILKEKKRNKFFDSGAHLLGGLYSKGPTLWTQFTLSLLAALGYVVYVQKDFVKNGTSVWGFGIMAIAFTVIVLFQCLRLYRIKYPLLIIRIVRPLTLVAVVIAVVLSMFSFVVDKKDLASMHSASLTMFYCLLGLCLLMWLIHVLHSKLSIVLNSQMSNKQAQQMFWLGVLNPILLVFLGAPLGLLASGSYVDFSKNLVYYLQPPLGLFSVCVLCFVLLNVVSSYKLIKWFGLICGILSFWAIINQFVFTGNYGDMSNFVFQSKLIISPFTSLLNILVLILIAGLFFILIAYKRFAIINKILLISLIAIVGLSCYNAFTFTQKQMGLIEGEKDELEPLITLSKMGKNVVILMMDRMIGGYIPKVLEMVPSLKGDLDGFSWYPKSLSEGAFTIVGVPTIVGGYDYSVDSINTTRTKTTLRQKLDEAYRVLPYNFNKAGYQSTIIEPSTRLLKKRNKKYLKGTSIKFPAGKYNTMWSTEHSTFIPKENVHHNLVMFGLFRILPEMFREWIYSYGKWDALSQLSLAKKQTVEKGYVTFSPSSREMKSTLKNWAVMEYLPKMTKTTDDSISQFYYFANDLVHEPWSIGTNLSIDLGGEILYPENVVKEFDEDLHSTKHLYATAAAIKLVAKWLNTLKELGVYDNTRIIIVSDHGRGVYNPMFNAQKVPLSKGEIRNSDRSLKNYELAWFHSALFVKDFNAKGALAIDSSFRRSADVPWMALDKIIDGINPYTGNPIVEPMEKFPFSPVYLGWRTDDQSKYKFKVKQNYTVHNDKIFDVLNWTASQSRDDITAMQDKNRVDSRVVLHEITHDISDTIDFSFKVHTNKKCSVSVDLRSFYGNNRKSVPDFKMKEGKYFIDSKQFFSGFNIVTVKVYSADHKLLLEKFIEVLKRDKKIVKITAAMLTGTQAWKSIKTDEEVTGKTLRINDKEYRWGLGTHAKSSYEMDLDGAFKTLQISHGLSSNTDCGDGALFKIILDGKTAYSFKDKQRNQFRKKEIKLLDIEKLELVTEQMSTRKCDHTNWINPVLVKK